MPRLSVIDKVKMRSASDGCQTKNGALQEQARRSFLFLLESLNRRIIVRRRFDDDFAPIMLGNRSAIDASADNFPRARACR